MIRWLFVELRRFWLVLSWEWDGKYVRLDAERIARARAEESVEVPTLLFEALKARWARAESRRALERQYGGRRVVPIREEAS